MKFANVLIAVMLLMFLSLSGLAQEVSAPKSKSWDLTGRVQVQHLFDNDTESDAARTNNGFRIRRGRFQISSHLNDNVSAKFQIEVRDNSPNLKDAEAKVKILKHHYLRFGQFKVPVWREELRSSGSLLLVERSAAAEFLADSYLSARHVGLEFGGKIGDNVNFAANYSNGAGEGGREDAGRTKGDVVNNGKMLSGRVNLAAGKALQFGVSGVMNSLGNQIGDVDNTGSVTVIAPDFGVYLPSGFDIEGGLALGSFSKDFLGSSEDISFQLFDVTARWKSKLKTPLQNLGGIDAFELAAGVSNVDPNTDLDNDEVMYFRFGPAVYFGRNARLQVNGEIDQPAADELDSALKVRSQLTINL